MSSKKEGNLIFGLILIVVGGFFLLRNLGWIPYYIDWELIWPVALVGFGAYLIFKHR